MKNKEKKKNDKGFKKIFRKQTYLQGDDDDVPFFARRYSDDHKSQNRMSRYAQKKKENKKAVVSIENGEDTNERSSEGLQHKQQPKQKRE